MCSEAVLHRNLSSTDMTEAVSAVSSDGKCAHIVIECRCLSDNAFRWSLDLNQNTQALAPLFYSRILSTANYISNCSLPLLSACTYNTLRLFKFLSYLNRKMEVCSMCNRFLIFVILKTDYTCYTLPFSGLNKIDIIII